MSSVKVSLRGSVEPAGGVIGCVGVSCFDGVGAEGLVSVVRGEASVPGVFVDCNDAGETLLGSIFEGSGLEVVF